MGATYTRQSTYTDGDTITAAHTNDEFDQLLAAFATSTGHTHDGTTAEGGPITKLLGNALTFGAGTAGTDITVTYDGESNDGVMKWMEDEDYFEFSDDILIASTEKLQFRDTGLYIYSSVDGQLDIVADTEVQIAATTIDINGAVDVSGNLDVGGNLTVTGTTTLNGGTLTLGDAATDNVVFGADVNSSIIPNTDNTYDLGSTGQRWKDAYVDGIAYIDTINFNGTAITSTAAELNIVDGDTSASAVTVVDADRVVLNDGGTMKQVAVTDLAAYFDDEITAMPNLVTTAATTVGALDSGSITSNFGTINNGTSTITTTGLISGGSLDIDDVVINGSNIGHTDDTDLITVSNGVLTVAGEVDAVSLDISGDADIDGTLEADAITIGGVTLAETISDTVGAMVSSNTETGVAVSYDDSDNTLDFVLGTAQTTIESIKNTSLVVGRDDDNLIKFSTDNQIIFEVSGGDNVIFKASGEIEASSLDISGDADIDGTLEADAITVNGTALNTVIAGVTTANSTLAATVTVTDSTANTNFPIVFHDESNALLDDTGALRYNPSTGELLVPKLTVAGTTTTVDTVTMNAANAIIFEGATADAHETTLTIVDPTADRTINLPNVSGTIPVLAAASNTAITSTPAELNILDGVTSTAAELNILDGVTSTAAELNILDGATVVVGEINALDLGSTAVGTAIASKAVILDSNKDYTGIRNFTISGEIDAATGDFSGAVDVAGATTAAAITASGIIKTDDTTDATSTTDGSLQTDGGLSVAKDAVIGDDLFLLSDSSVIHFGADSEITLAHTNNTGLTLNSGSGSNTFQIQNTDAGAGDGPIMKFYRNSSSPADADNVGEIRFLFNNDASEITEAAVIATKISDVSNGTEDSTLIIRSMSAGTMRSRIEMNASDTVINEDSVDLDFRVETNAEVNAFKIDGGAETAAFGVPVTFNDAANVAQAALTSSSNAIAWDATDKPNAYHLTTENTTFSAPSNAVEGAFIAIEINYNGSHTIAFNTIFEFAASTAPTFTSTDAKTDIMVFRYNGAIWQEVGRTINLSES